jgi:hypothetical protein
MKAVEYEKSGLGPGFDASGESTLDGCWGSG